MRKGKDINDLPDKGRQVLNSKVFNAAERLKSMCAPAAALTPFLIESMSNVFVFLPSAPRRWCRSGFVKHGLIESFTSQEDS